MKHIEITNNILLTILNISYPLIWLYCSKDNQNLHYILYILSLLWGIKAKLTIASLQHKIALFMSLIVFLSALLGGTSITYWYPVIINTVLFYIFSKSLWEKQTFIERLARLKDPNLSPKAVSYTRTVTKIWCLIFWFNIMITSFLIALEKFNLWATYTGFISYLIMGGVILLELCVRKRIT